MSEDLSSIEAVIRLLVAATLGGFIGLEREQRQKAAGLRTHMLVSLGSALFMVGAILFAQDAGSIRADASVLRLDPVGVFAAIVSGIGFIGAGQIFRANGTIQGITTAAAIWVTAGMGVLVGIGEYVVSIAAVAIVLVVVTGLGYVEANWLAATAGGKDAEPPTGSS